MQLRGETGISKLIGVNLHTRCSDVLLSRHTWVWLNIDRVLVLHLYEANLKQKTT